MRSIVQVILVCVLFFGTVVTAQEKKDILLGEKQMIRSNVLGENREIYVYAPEKILQKLPLIIVFDGESLFGVTAAAVKFMNNASEIPQMPEAIVVGIPNTNRDRDMPVPQQYGSDKGENNFMKFLQEELIPSLAKKYSLNGHTIAIGHSQGGLFVSYLLARAPASFPWVIALDAPMMVDIKTNTIKTSLAKEVTGEKNKIRYASVETLYGWDTDWAKFIPQKEAQFVQVKLKEETHESMPFKGIYDGLAFLYNDFRPARKDLTLAELQTHYQSLSGKYGHTYEIPLRVLTASAARKLGESRKTQVMDLLDYAELKYGATERTAKLKTAAAKISKEAPSVIDSFLSLPRPTAEQVKAYLGRWTGELTVPRGHNMPVDIEISIENGKAVMRSALAWAPEKKVEPDIFSISKKGELIFGRRNMGSGVVVTTARLEKGKIVGEEWLIGFTMPADFPAEAVEQMKFILENPNTLLLTKKS